MSDRRPAEELYDLDKDPDQLHNVAGNAAYTGVRDELWSRLRAALKATADPRVTRDPMLFDSFPYRARYELNSSPRKK